MFVLQIVNCFARQREKYGHAIILSTNYAWAIVMSSSSANKSNFTSNVTYNARRVIELPLSHPREEPGRIRSWQRKR